MRSACRWVIVGLTLVSLLGPPLPAQGHEDEERWLEVVAPTSLYNDAGQRLGGWGPGGRYRILEDLTDDNGVRWARVGTVLPAGGQWVLLDDRVREVSEPYERWLEVVTRTELYDDAGARRGFIDGPIFYRIVEVLRDDSGIMWVLVRVAGGPPLWAVFDGRVRELRGPRPSATPEAQPPAPRPTPIAQLPIVPTPAPPALTVSQGPPPATCLSARIEASPNSVRAPGTVTITADGFAPNSQVLVTAGDNSWTESADWACQLVWRLRFEGDSEAQRDLYRRAGLPPLSYTTQVWVTGTSYYGQTLRQATTVRIQH